MKKEKTFSESRELDRQIEGLKETLKYLENQKVRTSKSSQSKTKVVYPAARKSRINWTYILSVCPETFTTKELRKIAHKLSGKNNPTKRMHSTLNNKIKSGEIERIGEGIYRKILVVAAIPA